MTRAVVLGGGGPVGVGWESGLAVGLAEAGVALGAADLVVGTSAGSIVGARLPSGSIWPRRFARWASRCPSRPAQAHRSPT